MAEFARRLCSEGHYEQAEIGTRQCAMLQRRERVKQSAVDRRNKLEDCRKLMVFLQNCMEVHMYTQIEAYNVHQHMHKHCRREKKSLLSDLYVYVYVHLFVQSVVACVCMQTCNITLTLFLHILTVVSIS